LGDRLAHEQAGSTNGPFFYHVRGQTRLVGQYPRHPCLSPKRQKVLLGWERWNQDWGENLYYQTGFLVLAALPFRPGGVEHDSYQLLRQRGHVVELLDAAELRRRFPAQTAERYVQGYFNP
jgi:hypothetical protein